MKPFQVLNQSYEIEDKDNKKWIKFAFKLLWFKGIQFYYISLNFLYTTVLGIA